VFDDRVRDTRGAREGNDAALAGIYDRLQDGQPFHQLGMLSSV
jgi:hypothetical protein